jgi:hypothetical protein
MVPILPEFSSNAALHQLDARAHPETAQGYRMLWFGNIPSGVIFSDTQLYSADYSLQLAMGLQNFASLRCAKDAGPPRPELCAKLANWAELQRKTVGDALTFGTPGSGGAPITSR